MKLEDLEAKLGIADMGEEAKLALVKDIQANLPALKAEQRVLEAKTQANLVVEAIKKIKEGLEARFDELNGIVDVKVRDITSGKDGIDGKDGKDGVDGKDGKDGLSITGPKGADGQDGEDGVGVQDAHIDFDGSLIITLTDGRELNVGEVVPFDVAEKIKVIGNGGGTSQSVLDSLTSLQDQINVLTGIDGTLGTMAQQADTAVDINGGSIDSTAIGAAVPATGVFTTLTASAFTATGQTSLGGKSSDNTDVFRVYRDNTISGGVASFTAPAFALFPSQNNYGATVLRTSNQFFITSGGSGPVSLQTNAALGFTGTEQFRAAHTASAVNYVQVTGAATGGSPTLSMQGSDSSISLAFQSKGSGTGAYFTNSAYPTNNYFSATSPSGIASANRLNAAGAATTLSPVLSAVGSDTNIDLTLTPKGTGRVQFGSYTANMALTVQGYIEIKDSSGTVRKLAVIA